MGPNTLTQCLLPPSQAGTSMRNLATCGKKNLTKSAPKLYKAWGTLSPEQPGVSDPHLDLGRAPYGLYGVKYIALVSLPHVGGQCLTP